MIPCLLIFVPLVMGLAGFFFKSEVAAKGWALLSSLMTLIVALIGAGLAKGSPFASADCAWLPDLGSRFSVGLDGLSLILVLLTAVCFPLIFIATWRDQYKKSWNFYALMLLSQAGLMGVFLATDALLFYFFWELALIPVYFLASQWGGERRIQAAFKFFVYTFAGSLLMLVGIIWLYGQTKDHSFSMESFYALKSKLSNKDQTWIFWIMFTAFAIKMPIWPLHTWQPDAYEQAPTPVTMVLSAIMVKMGLFGVVRWLAPVVPIGFWAWGDTVSTACVIGMIYASLVAIKQDDLKRLVAYSSIAHVGLMCLAIFATDISGMQGLMIQMFSHGINILGMWIVIDLIERQFGTRKISELGGLAQKAPGLAVLLVIVALANVALPLTNGFVGEFLLFNGVFNSTATQYNVVFTVVAALSIILSAIYTLNMIGKVFYGNTNALTEKGVDIKLNEKFVLSAIVVIILVVGVYPRPILDLTKETADFILTKMSFKQ
jgi:NADH-quinone oxidoreductase subunit M